MRVVFLSCMLFPFLFFLQKLTRCSFDPTVRLSPSFSLPLLFEHDRHGRRPRISDNVWQARCVRRQAVHDSHTNDGRFDRLGQREYFAGLCGFYSRVAARTRVADTKRGRRARLFKGAPSYCQRHHGRPGIDSYDVIKMRNQKLFSTMICFFFLAASNRQ